MPFTCGNLATPAATSCAGYGGEVLWYNLIGEQNGQLQQQLAFLESQQALKEAETARLTVLLEGQAKRKR